jgi:O-6-methylguanine DNA methyltransferase
MTNKSGTGASVAAERFAAATDVLLQGEGFTAMLALDPDVATAQRLRAGAADGVPDPAFVQGLRGDLLARARARLSPAVQTVQFGRLETPVGPLWVAHRGDLVVYVMPATTDAATFARDAARHLDVPAEAEAEMPPALARAILNHLEGRKRFEGVDLSWLTPFQRKVLEKTAEIPRGEVRPYEWVAREIGAPGATRAVGTALGHNPIPFIIPCHRVVRSDHSLGEYSGGGPAVKERVLSYEGAPVHDLTQVGRRGERLRGSRTTHIVCYPTCHAAQRIRPENRRPFRSLAEATQQGFRPCKLCRPA